MNEDLDLARLDREIAILFDQGRYMQYTGIASDMGVYRFYGESPRAWASRREALLVRKRMNHAITSAMATDPQVIIYTHGVCRPVDPTGYGVIAWKAYLPNGTDPVAEYAAVTGRGRDSIWCAYEATINALRWAWLQGITRVVIRCSSQDAVLQIAKIWSVNSPELVAQRTVISMARRAMVALAVEHWPRADMPEVTALADRAYSEVEDR